MDHSRYTGGSECGIRVSGLKSGQTGCDCWEGLASSVKDRFESGLDGIWRSIWALALRVDRMSLSKRQRVTGEGGIVNGCSGRY